MGAAIPRRSWSYRLVRYIRVRIIRRYKLRNFWPSPDDIELMSTDEREAWFTSIGLDEQIAAARAEYLSETGQDHAQSPIPAGQARSARRDSSRA